MSERPQLHVVAEGGNANARYEATPESLAAPLAPAGSGPHDPGMEARVAKLEADVAHIQRDVGEIKGVLSQMSPVLNRVDGFLQAKLPHLATKEDMEKRPTWARITATVALITLIASLPFWQQWKALFKAVFGI